MENKNILDYLYYKIYRANLIGSAKDIAEFAAMIYVSGLLFENIFIIGAFLRKIDLLPFFIRGKNMAIGSIVCMFVVNYFVFMYTKRYKKIIAKYSQESEVERKRGNLITWIYVIVSFLLIFVVAFYKPGKL